MFRTEYIPDITMACETLPPVGLRISPLVRKASQSPPKRLAPPIKKSARLSASTFTILHVQYCTLHMKTERYDVKQLNMNYPSQSRKYCK
jgi:hypothetical protein